MLILVFYLRQPEALYLALCSFCVVIFSLLSVRLLLLFVSFCFREMLPSLSHASGASCAVVQISDLSRCFLQSSVISSCQVLI